MKKKIVVFLLTPVSLGFMRPGFKRFPGPKAHEIHSADKWLCKHSHQVAEKKTTKWQELISPHPKQQEFINPSTVWSSTPCSVLISSIMFSSIFFFFFTHFCVLINFKHVFLFRHIISASLCVAHLLHDPCVIYLLKLERTLSIYVWEKEYIL